jgi:hypothetical protein
MRMRLRANLNPRESRGAGDGYRSERVRLRSERERAKNGFASFKLRTEETWQRGIACSCIDWE